MSKNFRGNSPRTVGLRGMPRWASVPAMPGELSRPEAMANHMNAAELLLAVGDDRKVALECGDEHITYGGLKQAVSRAGGAWHSLGLAQDDRVIVFAPDSIDWVSAYLGVIWAGGVAIGVNPRLGTKDLATIVSDSQVGFIWTTAETAPALVEMARNLPHPLRILVPGGHPGCLDWRACLDQAKEIEAVQRSEEAMALWIGTSGTTGVPKGVIHAQRMVLPCAAFARDVLGLGSDARLYATSKLFFAYALGNSLLAGFRLGATVILDSEWPNPERVAEMAEKHRPTALFSVPTLYQKMLQVGVTERLKNAGIRHYVSAGEALPGPVRKEWTARTGTAPVSGYGTSETVCLMLYCAEESGRLRPTPLTEVRFPEESEAGVPRRIWIRHPALALGYWNRPKDQAECFKDGWYSPGDMFLRHPGGEFEFTGRDDDMLKVSGQWVSLLGVEQTLLAACGDSVAELAAAGVTGADGLSKVVVVAVAASGKELQANVRMDAGIAALPGFKRPKHIYWVDMLPRTATGKLQRRKLQEMFAKAGA